MKILTNKSVIQKIVLAIIFVILFTFAMPVKVQAGWFMEKSMDLLKELVHLIAGLGDVITRWVKSFYVRDDTIDSIFHAIAR